MDIFFSLTLVYKFASYIVLHFDIRVAKYLSKGFRFKLQWGFGVIAFPNTFIQVNVF
jgi:hypothetical protein